MVRLEALDSRRARDREDGANEHQDHHPVGRRISDDERADDSGADEERHGDRTAESDRVDDESR